MQPDSLVAIKHNNLLNTTFSNPISNTWQNLTNTHNDHLIRVLELDSSVGIRYNPLTEIT